MTHEISHRHLPPLRCSDLVKGAARRYTQRTAARHGWTAEDVADVLAVLGLEVPA